MRRLRLAVGILPCLLMAALAAATSSQGATRTVDVYPIAATTTANPATQISFRGATHLKSLTGSSGVGCLGGATRAATLPRCPGAGFCPRS
jgi:hypothetical protein